ncbi:isochorismate synthase [Photobacterium atrarenae]|uniref:Isochorismate synthase MenF n=1 Tax=Photobacterium atrarenae TaxID=865757 RepID=A0ABY5GCG9_9GAMM|nr:isochorismate synthase [Photobacterium atrarenae]UTV26917.1 isochorismate synthase [Photobacterium atrarenae]
MTGLQTAISSLVESIQAAGPSTHRVSVAVCWPETADVIGWMASQPIYPQFFWQARDGRETVVALGQLQTFSEPVAAEQAVRGQQRVWGGQSFDSRTVHNRRCLSAFFFLPALELSQTPQGWQLSANLAPEHKERTVQVLQQLVPSVARIPAIRCGIRHRSDTPDFAQWSETLDQALHAIEQGALDKVVLARRTTLSLDGTLTPAQLLQASRSKNHSSFHFMLAQDARHGFVGSTPERLFLRQAESCRTEALAGTIARGHGEAEDYRLAQWLLEDSKNRYENQLVVDDIVQRLTPCCSELAVAGTPELVKLRQIQHLKRSISAALNIGVTSAALLECLQPTAAIAGLPRDAALGFIETHEPFARGWYSGAVGYIGQAQSEFCVAIRSALMQDGELHLFAGAGIVPGSTAVSEWQELERKTETLSHLLGAENTAPEIPMTLDMAPTRERNRERNTA